MHAMLLEDTCKLYTDTALVQISAGTHLLHLKSWCHCSGSFWSVGPVITEANILHLLLLMLACKFGLQLTFTLTITQNHSEYGAMYYLKLN